MTYLLLRNNKESGPYDLEGLLQFGLKPYDLIWVKGKSAAWRYPSEIEELKPYAPEVEEQPFDRFYKKPVSEEEKKEPAPVVRKMIPRPTVKTGYEPKPVTAENFVPRKSVFVTLPGGQANQEKKPIAPPTVAEPVDETVAETIVVTENPASKVKYSQPLDEIKEMYVKTLQDRKERIARKSFLHVNIKRAAVVTGLVGLGVLAGFIIKPKTATPPSIGNGLLEQQSASALLTDKVVQESKTADSIRELAGSSSSATKEENVGPQQPVTDAGNTVVSNKPPNSTISEKKNEPVTGKETASIPVTRDFSNQRESFVASEKDPLTGERSRSLRSATPIATEGKAGDRDVAKATLKNPLSDQVSVTSNDYKRVAFGGIRNLELTVTNRSKYALENVIVELQYLKPSEQPLRTENVQFRGIAPNESSTIRIPDTNRGIKVSYRILHIESRQNKDDVAGR